MNKRIGTSGILIFIFSFVAAQDTSHPEFRNPGKPVEQRVSDLLKRLTIEEKISLLGYEAKAVTRLQIPQYNWWSEALHGVARAGEATIFPQAIGMAATFNDSLLQEVASAISTEARAKYNLAIEKDRRLMYMGLTFWSPNINIFRDPRWGRGQETYGEDPFLTGVMGSAFVRGMQGNDPVYLKTAACAKHYAVHSGPEKDRHGFNVNIDEKQLRETYLYAFHKLVKNGVEAVMTAYNSVNGQPCSINSHLVQDILRKEWHFNGHVVTDCGALYDIWQFHKTYDDPARVAAEAIRNGINVDCSNLLQKNVLKAVDNKWISEKDIDQALIPSLRTQFKLGFFDPATPFSGYGKDSIANAYHLQLARKMAQQSMVLLKNNDKLLPLDKSRYGAYMVLGPNAASVDAMMGNYHGVSSQLVTFLDGITKEVGKDARVEYDMGCDYQDTTRFGGIWAAGNADISIVFLGLTPVYEGEEGDAFLAENGADRLRLGIPRSHLAFLKQLREKTKTPIVVVLTAGSAIDIAEIDPYADAILLAWYPGQQGGAALADILFGRVSPSGHLPVTFYRSLQDLPDYKDYNMQNRTYRYFKEAVQFPFGFGMSYANFAYRWISQPRITADSVCFSIAVRNTGAMLADEVVQVYVSYPPGPGLPVKELRAFQRVSLETGMEKTIEFRIPLDELKKWSAQNNAWQLLKGGYELVIGEHSADKKLETRFIIK